MTALTGDWNLIEVDGNHIAEGTVLKFEEDRLSYRYGNNYFQQCAASNGNIQLGTAAGTRMFCHMDPPENVVTNAITSSTHYVIEGDTLKLTHDGKVQAVLKKA